MKQYFKIYVQKKENSEIIVIGYHHGKNVKATKLYKETYFDFAYKEKYYSIGTHVIDKVEFQKATLATILKPILPAQGEFLESLWFDVSMNKKSIPWKEEDLLKELVVSKEYNFYDAPMLNEMLKKYKK
jgi:hypothetical protein